MLSGERSMGAEARLARYKCPRIWQQVDRLPRIGNGKLDRRALPSLWTPV